MSMNRYIKPSKELALNKVELICDRHCSDIEKINEEKNSDKMEFFLFRNCAVRVTEGVVRYG